VSFPGFSPLTLLIVGIAAAVAAVVNMLSASWFFGTIYSIFALYFLMRAHQRRTERRGESRSERPPRP
jgi:hypothetical protein